MLGVYLPACLPALSVLLGEFFSPSAANLAAAFGVSRSTAHRWISTDRAPRAVLMALYLAAPRYGGREAAAHVLHAQEGQRLALALAESVRRELTSTRRELARVVSVGEFGSANSPSFSAQTPAELLEGRGAVPLALHPGAHGR